MVLDFIVSEKPPMKGLILSFPGVKLELAMMKGDAVAATAGIVKLA